MNVLATGECICGALVAWVPDFESASTFGRGYWLLPYTDGSFMIHFTFPVGGDHVPVRHGEWRLCD